MLYVGKASFIHAGKNVVYIRWLGKEANAIQNHGFQFF
jgi:hypothetical protein